LGLADAVGEQRGIERPAGRFAAGEVVGIERRDVHHQIVGGVGRDGGGVGPLGKLVVLRIASGDGERVAGPGGEGACDGGVEDDGVDGCHCRGQQEAGFEGFGV